MNNHHNNPPAAAGSTPADPLIPRISDSFILHFRLDQLKAQCGQLQDQLDEQTARLDADRRELDACNRQLRALSDAQAANFAEAKAHQNELEKSLADAQAQAQNRMDGLRKEQSATRQQLAEARQSLEETRQALQAARQEWTSAVTELRSADARFNDFNNRCSAELHILEALCGLFLLILLAMLWLRRRSLRRTGAARTELREQFRQMERRQAVLSEALAGRELQLLEIAKQLMQNNPTASEPDHAPMLKFASEISRMEMNLSRMDEGVKGRKQLARGLEHIRDNMAACGYEMVPMLDQPYYEGLRADADFVPDDSLPVGERRITAVSRPQVNYRGVMIQKARVTVSQNI